MSCHVWHMNRTEPTILKALRGVLACQRAGEPSSWCFDTTATLWSASLIATPHRKPPTHYTHTHIHTTVAAASVRVLTGEKLLLRDVASAPSRRSASLVGLHCRHPHLSAQSLALSHSPISSWPILELDYKAIFCFTAFSFFFLFYHAEILHFLTPSLFFYLGKVYYD